MTDPKPASTRSLVVHMVPYDGIGGVETAARSMRNLKHDFIDFKVNFIFKKVTHTRQRWTTFNPFSFLSAIRKVTIDRPDVLIISLWRSAIVGVFAKLLRPDLKLVVFIHCPNNVHWLDFIFTRFAISLAQEVWADSLASQGKRFPNIKPEKWRIISFVTRNFEVLPAKMVRPNFIFWGRISHTKGLASALRIFSGIREQQPSARFWIIGPDGGSLNATKQLCETLGVTEAVVFLGAATLDEIATHAKKASFYLQTSLFEGMAMSVVEAMQMGLVPIVTAVGEIDSYCQSGENSVVIDTEELAIESVLTLLACDAQYKAMRSKAIATWNDVPRYAESVLHACEALLAANQKIF